MDRDDSVTMSLKATALMITNSQRDIFPPTVKDMRLNLLWHLFFIRKNLGFLN